MRVLTPAELPIETLAMIDLNPGEPFSVAEATKWADAVLEFDITDEPVLAVYTLDDDGHACAALVPDLLRCVGAWRETAGQRVALKRDLMVQSVLDGRLSPESFAREAMLLAQDLHTVAGAEDEASTYYLIEDMVDAARPRDGQPADREHFKQYGFDPADPLPWIVRQLREAGVVDGEGKVVPAAWGDAVGG